VQGLDWAYSLLSCILAQVKGIFLFDVVCWKMEVVVLVVVEKKRMTRWGFWC
jgi:hypothetical protein